MNGAIGFNPEEISKAYKQIQAAYGELEYNYVNGINKIFAKLSNNWFSPQGVQFGEWSYDEALKTLLYEIYPGYKERFLLFVVACNEWARTVGSNMVYPEPGNPRISWEYPTFRDNNNGFVGIYSQNLQDINVDFRNVLNQFDTDTAKIINVIQSNSLFYGLNQAESFLNTIKSWKGIATSSIGRIIDEMNVKVKETEETYMKTAQANAQRFSSGN